MRRALALVVMVLAIMIIAVSCEEPHVHTFSEEWTSDATYHWHKATCGHDEVSEKAEHVWGEYVIDKDSTETEKGSKHRVCSVCGYTETSVVAEKKHDHNLVYRYNGSKHWQVCTKCGEEFDAYSHSLTKKYDENVHYQQCYCGYTTTKTEHTFGDKTTDINKKTTQTCSSCGYTKFLAAEENKAVDLAGKNTEVQNNKTVVKDEVKVTVNVSAVSDTDSSSQTGGTSEETEIKKTETMVTFPAGALKVNSTGGDVTLTVKAIATTEVTSDKDYKVEIQESGGTSTTEKAVVAGFEFTLTGADSKDLAGTDNSGTTVKTYISSGLGEVEDLEVVFVGTADANANKTNPKVNKYDNSTGYLEFTVYHFSKYAIVSTNMVAVDSSGKMYPTLAKALSDAKSGATITLLKDTTEKLSSTIGISKNLTLDLNGRTLTLSNTGNVTSAFKVSSTFTVKNGKEIVGGIDCTIFELTSSGKLDLIDVPCTDIYWYLKDDEATTFTIDTLPQLRGLAELVNGTAKESTEKTITAVDFSEKTITLGHDIELNGEEWTPIGVGTRSESGYTDDSTPFRGIFDGNGKTIPNLTIDTTKLNVGEEYCLGLFGVVDGGTIKSLTLKNVSITAKKSKTVGSLVGLAVNNSTIENITVESGTIKTMETGGIVGRMTISGTIRNCMNGADVTSEGEAGGTGGIVSKAYYSEKEKTIIIDNCKNTGKIKGCGEGAGGITGFAAAEISNCINTGSVDGEYSVGGIAGEVLRYGFIKDSENSGKVTGTSNYGVGGIVGWTRYNNTGTDYKRTEIIEISGNKNTGEVCGSGNTGVGGIIGMVYNVAKVNKNTNSAARITGGSMVAGIVGGYQNTEACSISDYLNQNEMSGNKSSTFGDNIIGSNKAVLVYNNESTLVTEEDSVCSVVIDGTTWYMSLEDALKNGSEIALVKDIDLNKSIYLSKSVTVDMNSKKLTVKNIGKDYNAFYLRANESAYTVTFKNGTIQTDPNNTSRINHAFSVNNNAVLNLENVEIDVKAYTCVYLVMESNPATLIVTNNSSLYNSYGYGIGTNATNAENTHVNLTIENSKINDVANKNVGETGLMINVPCTVLIENSTIAGDCHGVIFRATDVSSSVEVKNSTIRSVSSKAYKYEWDGGNVVPQAALTIGNSSSKNSGYPRGTKVVLTNVTLECGNTTNGKHLWVEQASVTNTTEVSGTVKVKDGETLTHNGNTNGATVSDLKCNGSLIWNATV